jgi:hypothetical protein
MPKEASKAKVSGTRKKYAKAPKLPMSPYMFFVQDWRERIKAENPDASFGEVGKLLGVRWKECSDEEKMLYVVQAAQDKARAEREYSEYENKNAGSGDGEDNEE